MANPDRQNRPKTHRTVQDVQNSGFDETFQVPVVELLAYNSGSDTLDRVQIGGDGALLTGSRNFNHLAVANTSSTTDTLTYKSGGSGGTTVQTIVVTYPNSNVEKLSSSISAMDWS